MTLTWLDAGEGVLCCPLCRGSVLPQGCWLCLGVLGCDSPKELVQRELSRENESGPGKDLGITRSVLKLIGNLTSSQQGG